MKFHLAIGTLQRCDVIKSLNYQSITKMHSIPHLVGWTWTIHNFIIRTHPWHTSYPYMYYVPYAPRKISNTELILTNTESTSNPNPYNTDSATLAGSPVGKEDCAESYPFLEWRCIFWYRCGAWVRWIWLRFGLFRLFWSRFVTYFLWQDWTSRRLGACGSPPCTQLLNGACPASSHSDARVVEGITHLLKVSRIILIYLVSILIYE